MKSLVCLMGIAVALVAAKPPTAQQVREAIMRAKETNAFKRDLNLNLKGSTSTVDEAVLCPMARYHGRRTATKVTSDRKTNDLLLASRFLKEAGFSESELQDLEVINELRLLTDNCPSDAITCNATSRFRSANGFCNNIEHPSWGAAGTPQVRLVEPAYDDGLSTPRTRSVTAGESLPNPRKVSNRIHTARGKELKSQRLTLHTFQFGQMLDHDLIATPIQGEVADCCSSPSDVDNCFPIRIEWEGDPNPNFPNGYCMNFHRSAPQFCPTSDGANRREQINELTSFIDASCVYGSSFSEQFMIREDGDGGFLASEDHGLRLPNNDNEDFCIPNENEGVRCSLAGDFRVNVVPSLTAYHTLFMREHNRIAAQLFDKCTDSDLLFQETRKILIAIVQKITYDEFLPSFLGSEAMRAHGLRSSDPYVYDPNVNPSVSNDFGIAYRMGHTWIPRNMVVFDPEFRELISKPTEETFFDPELTYFQGTRGLDGLTLWLTGDNSTETDSALENAVRNDLFLDRLGNSFDLAALNIQRGRDHGLPSYTKYRMLCDPNEPEITDFNDLVDHDFRARRALKQVYSDPRDIDMFTGALAERTSGDSDLGPTLQCILGKQFNRLKYGDRFWYQGHAADFTQEQLEAIGNYSLAKLLCNNYDFRSVNFPNAFLATDELTACSDIPQLDIVPFGGIPDRPRPPVTTARTSHPTMPPAAPLNARPTDAPGKRQSVEDLLETLLERLEE